MRTFILLFLIIHGLIHFTGFLKAFELAIINELSLPISHFWGFLWLTAGILIITAGTLWFTETRFWWLVALFGLILSQILIFEFWQDARFGTVPNIILLSVLIITQFFTPTQEKNITVNATYKERYEVSDNVKIHPLFVPFKINIDPMERLLLINIENDPDSVYTGFEPQVFDDELNGTGILVIAWRVDGKVDVYHQPGIMPEPDKYDITGKGLANMVVKSMEDASFVITDKGVQAHVEFEDLYGRAISLNVNEKSNRTRKPFGLLAPMGQAAESPSSMPLVILHDFYFVRRSNTDISIKIDGRVHKPDKLPLPLDFSFMYFARYSPDPLIVTLNQEFEGELHPLTDLDEDKVSIGETSYEVVLNGSVHELQSISQTHQNHTVTITFTPAFPNLDAFTALKVKGAFEISGEPTTGKVRGFYEIYKNNDKLTLEMIPSEGWIPNERKLSLRFLYRVAPIFKKWPTTYRWTADIQKDSTGVMLMKSSWERT